MVWYATILNIMFLNLSCFQVIYAKTQTVSFSPRVSMIFRVCVGSSLTVGISSCWGVDCCQVANIILHHKLVIADMRMLNPVQLLTAWSSSEFDIRVSNHLKFLTWQPGPVCLCSLHSTLLHYILSDYSGLHSHAIDPARCALSTDRLLRAVYIAHASVMDTPW